MGDLYSLWVDINTTAGLPRAGSNQLYSLWVDVNTTQGAAQRPPAATAPFALTLYVADTQTPAGSGAPAYPAPSLVVRVEDGLTRSALAPDVALRRYVPAPAYAPPAPGPPWNSAGAWGLGAGLLVRVSPVAADVRLRVYCVAGCYASVSAVFFDPVVG